MSEQAELGATVLGTMLWVGFVCGGFTAEWLPVRWKLVGALAMLGTVAAWWCLRDVAAKHFGD